MVRGAVIGAVVVQLWCSCGVYLLPRAAESAAQHGLPSARLQRTVECVATDARPSSAC